MEFYQLTVFILAKQLCITNLLSSIRGKGGQILHHDCAQCKCCHDTHCTMIDFPKILSDDNDMNLVITALTKIHNLEYLWHQNLLLNIGSY